jgi:hypothetical protein
MLLQLTIGTVLILLTTTVAGMGFLVLEKALDRVQNWLRTPPHQPKLLVLLIGSVFWVLMIVTACVWIWAVALWLLPVFITMEASVYFSIVAFTTLGFGDILLPQDWRLLAGLTAVNGLLMFGFLTAMLVEVLRRVRNTQSEGGGWTS